MTRASTPWPRPRREEDEETPFRPTRRFTKRKPKDTRPFKPGWFELVLDLLRSYLSRTGTTLVPAKHREGGFGLGFMVVYLRARYRQGKLSPERVRKLERLPGWSWDPIQEYFDQGLRLLKQFSRREGHPDVKKSQREQGFDLHHWVERQRRLHRQGRLSRSRTRALESVPAWSWHGKTRDRRFHHGLSALRAFASRNGHTRVPFGYHTAGVNLHRWAILQREAYHEGKLSPARIRALEAVPGWSWQPLEDRFEEGIRHLRRFAARHGHSRVPRHHEERGHKLGIWVMQQRQFHRKGRLSPDRARRLERLLGWTWNARATRGGARKRSAGATDLTHHRRGADLGRRDRA